MGHLGLAGVWAEENTREAIHEAFKRKETFGTSGPRINKVFAGYSFEDPNLVDTNLIKKAYAQNTTMKENG